MFLMLVSVWIVTLYSDSRAVVVNLSNRGLTAIPANLPRDMTVLDLSNNKIKEVFKTDLRNYRELQSLFLQNNQIGGIEDGTFRTLGNLTAINLSGNDMNLSNYSDFLFEGLENLAHLDLTRNLNYESSSIRHYPDKAFAVLPSLTFLGLDLDFKPVFGEGFRNLSKLEALKFENCFIGSLGNETFLNFPQSILSLSITNCRTHFVEVDMGALLPFPNLESLDLSGSCLHLIQALMIINPFRNKNFKTLDFYGLNCPYFNGKRYPYTLTITPEMTRHLQTMCVETLNVGDNGIAEIQPNSLFKMHHPECLKNLTFRENRFFIEYGTILSEVKEFLKKCINLKMLDVSFLLGRYYPDYIEGHSKHFDSFWSTKSHKYESKFHKRKHIGTDSKRTDQNDQSIEGISFQLVNRNPDQNIDHGKTVFSPQFHDSTFIEMPNSLETLLANSVITYDYPKVLYFRNGSSLKYIDASFSNVNMFYVLPDPSGKMKIETIVINGTPYKTFLSVERGVTNYSLSKLVWRNSDLSGLIYSLKTGNLKFRTKLLTAINKLKTLEILDVSHNFLFQWDKHIFAQINQLKKLDFSDNSFQYMPEEIQSLEHLQELDFRHNRLTTLEENFRSWLDKKNEFTLHLDDNAFKCDCSNLDFIEWLRNTKVKLDKEAYLCTLQDGTLIDTAIAYDEMNKLFKTCYSNFWLATSIASLSSIVIVCLSFCLYSRRWNVTLYFYKKFKFLLQRKYQKRFPYDVYVSYDSQSIGWIKDTLIPKLENTWGLKLCLRDRDTLAGGSMFDSEASNIEMSRHALFVIGKNFSAECERLFEVEQVKYEKLMRNIENIIVIAKDVDISDLPVELSFLWRYVSFISWSNNDRDLDVIWKKLQIWTCETFSYESAK